MASRSMDPRLVAQLQEAVRTFLTKKGVPDADMPAINFHDDEYIVRSYRQCVGKVDEQYDLGGDAEESALISHLKKLVTDFKSQGPAISWADFELAPMREALRSEFNAPFIGDAHLRLHAYLLACWQTYTTTKGTYRQPYIAIVQSAGFGKSSLIQELARKCAEDTSKTVNVLYGSVDGRSIATLVGRLVAAYRHVARGDNWDVASTDLLKLFDDSEADRALTSKFREMEAQATSAQEINRQGHASQKASRVLVLAIDDANELLASPGKSEAEGWIWVLRNSLEFANRKISSAFGDNAGIFVVLVGTNPKICGSPPPQSTRSDPSQRYGALSLFPPFELTESVDVCFHQGEVLARERVVEKYRSAVSEALACEETSWESLRCMGRPLWMRSPYKMDLIKLAAKMLLGGVHRLSPHSFERENLYGVSSVLCRVGFCPSATSPFASRAVAEFMAVLAYISFENDQVLCSYSSDPILTLGATYLWHAFPSALATHILPQLRRTLLQELTDTGGMQDTVAARLVLLLAMDACGVLRTGKESSRYEKAGEFSSVWTLLVALHGDAPDVRSVTDGIVSSSSPHEALAAIRAQWEGWFVSFTQFVELTEEPTEACLWAMLGRRVAGVLPRGQQGIDFVVPIVKKDASDEGLGASVSMILVQVKDGATVASKSDDELEVVADSLLQSLQPHQVLLIIMSLSGHAEPSCSYSVDSRGKETAYTLRRFGMRGWSSRLDATHKPVEVVSDAVAKQLEHLIGNWCNVAEAVAVDVGRRLERAEFGRPPQELIAGAKRTLAETLILNDVEPEATEGTAASMATDRESFSSNSTVTGRTRGRSVGGDDSKRVKFAHP